MGCRAPRLAEAVETWAPPAGIGSNLITVLFVSMCNPTNMRTHRQDGGDARLAVFFRAALRALCVRALAPAQKTISATSGALAHTSNGEISRLKCWGAGCPEKGP